MPRGPTQGLREIGEACHRVVVEPAASARLSTARLRRSSPKRRAREVVTADTAIRRRASAISAGSSAIRTRSLSQGTIQPR